MTNEQHPIEIFRKIAREVRGIEKAEEWKIYMAVACLSLAISLMILLYSTYTAWFSQDASLGAAGNRHITLQGSKISRPAAAAAPKAKREPQANKEKAPQATEAGKAQEAVGDWYYDEVHKDWRYGRQKKG